MPGAPISNGLFAELFLVLLKATFIFGLTKMALGDLLFTSSAKPSKSTKTLISVFARCVFFVCFQWPEVVEEEKPSTESLQEDPFVL